MFTLTRVPIIAVIIAVIEISIGLVGNGFIVVIKGMDWMKSRKLSSCDMILSCLGMSSIIMQGAAVVSHSYSFFRTEPEHWIIYLLHSESYRCLQALPLVGLSAASVFSTA